MNKVTLSSFRETALKKLGAETCNEIDQEASLIAANVIHMQSDVSDSLKSYMDKTGEGFNEVQRKLGVSPTKLNDLLKGKGNFTLKTISEVGALLGKRTAIVFE